MYVNTGFSLQSVPKPLLPCPRAQKLPGSPFQQRRADVGRPSTLKTAPLPRAQPDTAPSAYGHPDLIPGTLLPGGRQAAGRSRDSLLDYKRDPQDHCRVSLVLQVLRGA